MAKATKATPEVNTVEVENKEVQMEVIEGQTNVSHETSTQSQNNTVVEGTILPTYDSELKGYEDYKENLLKHYEDIKSSGIEISTFSNLVILLNKVYHYSTYDINKLVNNKGKKLIEAIKYMIQHKDNKLNTYNLEQLMIMKYEYLKSTNQKKSPSVEVNIPDLLEIQPTKKSITKTTKTNTKSLKDLMTE